MPREVTPNLIAEMQSVLAHSLEEINTSADLRNNFGLVYLSWTGSTLCCPAVIPQEYYNMESVVRQYLNNKIKMSRPKSKYQLPAEMLLWFSEKRMHVGNINMTDELGAELLDAHPEYKKHFVELPGADNSQDNDAGTQETKASETGTKASADPEAEQPQTLAARIKASNKEQLVAIAIENNLDKPEWENLNAKNLSKYLTAKLSA